MFKPAALFLGIRYSRARHGNRFTRFINRFALAGILIGVAALIIVSSVMNGFEAQLKQRILGVVPQLTITSNSTAGISDWQQLAASIPKLPGQRALVPQVGSAGVVQSSGQLRPVYIQGLFPDAADAREQFQPLNDNILYGSLNALQEGSYSVVLGQTLAQQLDVWPGDSIRVIAAAGGIYTPLGLMPAQRQFTVAGIVAMQSEADKQLLIMHGADAARLLRLPQGHVSALRFYFKDPFNALTAEPQLKAHLDSTLTTHTWREQYGELFDAVSMEKRMVGLMLGLIIAVAAFNIVSALMMVIQDKRSDIAILQTMGMRRGHLYLMFMIQGLANGVVGALVGLLLGVTGASYVNEILSALQVDLSFTGQAGLPVLMQSEQIITIVLAAMLLTLLATFYPAWRASQILPAEALRYE
ncbi:lipoprotein-releasing ABC transporter permease subunit [Pseudidiomarina gelatinasegens]|uniref:lipoprotein-releasing ABC transporter permease subunit n=1 Tax=Pseudidiomarina gelatinasegens TaxID=2487740 RepID=UPI0030EF0E92|tara:strand:- start:160 stop:1401 length:1242 start_codon:yes stop_codon:yes gene_type:complete